jgi:hypothetical protein
MASFEGPKWTRLDFLSSLLGREAINVTDTKLSQLWTGFGSVRSLRIKTIAESADQRTATLIIKVVDRPPSVKARGDEGHNRDVQSYIAESTFYRIVATELLKKGVIVPHAHHVECSPDGNMLIVMSDLRPEYPIHGTFTLNENMMYASLDWLAQFHAATWQKSELWTGSDMWTEGSYWRLDVRRTEYAQIVDPQWQRLKVAAEPLAEIMKVGTNPGVPYKYMSLIHGDIKGTNLMFRPKGGLKPPGGFKNAIKGPLDAASFDFQWVGGSFGARDLVMLLVSSVKFTDTLENGKDLERQVLAMYHERLVSYIAAYCEDEESKATDYTLEQLTMHYELCLIDYVRFMSGWSLWGNLNYAIGRTHEIMDTIDGGRILVSSDAYREAIQRLYVGK